MIASEICAYLNSRFVTADTFVFDSLADAKAYDSEFMARFPGHTFTITREVIA